jgi:hypothetical protein
MSCEPTKRRYVGEPADKECKTAAKNEVSSETENLDGLVLIGQVSEERFQRGFALSSGASRLAGLSRVFTCPVSLSVLHILIAGQRSRWILTSQAYDLKLIHRERTRISMTVKPKSARVFFVRSYGHLCTQPRIGHTRNRTDADMV